MKIQLLKMKEELVTLISSGDGSPSPPSSPQKQSIISPTSLREHRKIFLVLAAFIIWCLFLYTDPKNASVYEAEVKPNRFYLSRPKISLDESIQENKGQSVILSNQHVKESKPPSNGSQSTKMKYILYYTPFFTAADWGFGFGQQPFIDAGCPVTNCFTTNDQKFLNSSMANFDAILFHSRNLNNYQHVPNQIKRRPEQRYVMMLMESPMHDYLDYTRPRFKGFFNWTMTYRLDSDIPKTYGYLTDKNAAGKYFDPTTLKDREWRKQSSADLIFTEEVRQRAKRKKLVAWVVSNCNTKSNREGYVKEMQKYIQVDIFGGCGTPVKCKEGRCQDLVEDYKFYLSFENSICKEYATEKFFTRLGRTVPVVLGGLRGDYARMAPPGSYIDFRDYESPRDLAEFLLYLDKHDDEYLSYYWWEKYYEAQGPHKGSTMCKLCEMLNNEAEPRKVYEDMNEWWRVQSQCKVPKNGWSSL